MRLKLELLDQSLPYMHLSLKQVLKTDDLIAQGCAHRGLGDIYLASAMREKALCHYQMALNLFREAGETIGASEIEIKLGEIQID
ncbi:hypothetical protein ACVR09_01470 [Streptococcus catagoni]